MTIMKKRQLVGVLVCIAFVAIGGYALLKEKVPEESPKKYTYEELNALPADELLNLFIENGLVINERLEENFTKEELSKLFKSQFPLLHQGTTSISDIMYNDLAERTKEVFDKIVEP